MNFLILKRKYLAAALVITLFAVSPLTAFCQEQDQDQEDQDFNSLPVPSGGSSSSPVIGSSSPWGNSSSGSQGQNGANEANGSTVTGSNHLAPATPGSGTLRRPAKVLGTGPGGSPDVPFDDNMNLIFLLSGVLFSFLVVRSKKLRVVLSNKIH